MFTLPNSKLVPLIVSLARGADLDILPSVVEKKRLPAALRMAELLKSFNYLDSVEFHEIISGKSETVAAGWRRRFSQPMAKAQKCEEFYAAAGRMLEDNSVWRYLPEEGHKEVTVIRTMFAASENQGLRGSADIPT